MRGLRSTLILFVALVALGAYIYFVESKREPAGTERKEKIFTFEAKDIEEITVKNSTGQVTTVEKSDQTWDVTAPEKLRADESELTNFTNSLASLEIQRVVNEQPADLAEYGLAEPKFEVSFRTVDSGEPRRLLFGEKNAAGGDMYAKLADEKRVLLVSAYLDGTFNRSTFDFRDKIAIAFNRDAADQLSIRTVDGTIEITKTENGWRMNQPVQARADYGAVESLLGKLNTLPMKSIEADKAEDLKPFGLETPVATVTIRTGSSRATIAMGTAKEGGAESVVYARDESRPMVFTIDATMLDDVKKPATDFRRKDAFEFRSFNATHLEITRDGKTYVFDKRKAEGEKAEEKWHLTSPESREVDAARMDDLMVKLSNLRAQSFLDATTKTGLDSPSVTVAATFDGGKREERVVFAQSDSDVFASRPDEPGAMKMDPVEYKGALSALQRALMPRDTPTGTDTKAEAGKGGA